MPRAIALALSLALACSRSEGGPAPGHERGPCDDGGGCDLGLECWSQRCVRPPPADCQAVGERLAAVSLGNYATPEERAPRVGELAAQCERERLTGREGRCLAAAATEDELAACPRPLLPELVGDPRGCARVGARAAELLAAAALERDRLRPLLKVMPEVAPALTAACVDARWPAPAKQCVLALTGFADVERCRALLDGGDRRALDRTVEQLVKKGMRTRRPLPSGDDPWE